MKRTYPDLICWDCVERTGKELVGKMKVAESEANCGICKCKGIVVSPKDVGHFTSEQLAKARAEVKRLGIKGNDALDPKAVDKALIIVEGVLKDGMSFWTRKVFTSIKEDFERGKKITKYDLEKLMYWFAKDVDMRGNKDGCGCGGSGESIPADGSGHSIRREGSPMDGKKRILIVGS